MPDKVIMSILMYHYIGDGSNGEIGAQKYTVSLEKFRQQMMLVSQMPAGKITVSFDDGDESNYQAAYPILKEFGLTGYFFVLAGKIGQKGFLTVEQIKEMHDARMVIGSHGMTHRILNPLTSAEIEHEVAGSKLDLEKKLHFRVDYFSIPRGFYNSKVLMYARMAGYKKVFTSDIGGDDGFRCGRIAVKADWSLEKFKYVVEHGLPWQDKVVENIKGTCKSILGASGYDAFRSRVLMK